MRNLCRGTYKYIICTKLKIIWNCTFRGDLKLSANQIQELPMTAMFWTDPDEMRNFCSGSIGLALSLELIKI